MCVSVSTAVPTRRGIRPVAAETAGEIRTFRLQVPVNKPHKVQVFQCCRNLRSVEPRSVLREALSWPRLECPEELASHAVLHAEVEVVLGLEGVVQRDDEGMICRCEDLLLRQGALDLFPLYHLLLGEDCMVLRLSCIASTLGGGNGAPFMANSLPVFFSRTRYTFPTSPLPSILILWKLPGPTSTYTGSTISP